jgi:Kef-type K+ transport system membrane component KefB
MLSNDARLRDCVGPRLDSNRVSCSPEPSGRPATDDHRDSGTHPRRRRYFDILGMKGLAVPVLSLTGIFATIGLAVSSGMAPIKGGAHTDAHELFHVLLAMAAVAALAQVIGRFFVRLRQPAVVGEMLAGLLLGPSLLGRVSPAAAELLLPRDVGPYLRLVAQIGVVLFMFLVGLHLDTGWLRRRVRSAAAISASGIAVPLVIGGCASFAFYSRYAPKGVSFLVFAAFFAVAMAITAFPVLARIVAERKLQNTQLGIMALTCAAVDDVTAWCLLAAIASLAGAKSGSGLVILGMTAVYVAIMVGVVKPLLGKFLQRMERPRDIIPSVFLLLLISALVTEWIGIHALFGAFLLGAILPSHGELARQLNEKLEDVVKIVLLPIFFVFTGMRTEVGLLSGWGDWLVCLSIVALAFLGKLGGVTITARLLGVRWRQAFALGALMNTRGLMELVVLNLGLDLGVISKPLFAMMVIMAVLTTLAAGPLLDALGRTDTIDEGGEAARAQTAT